MGIFRKSVAIGTVVFSAALWIWSGARAILDFLGRAMAVQDFADPSGLVAKGLSWLFSTPAWMPALIAGAFSLFLMFLLLKKETPKHALTIPPHQVNIEPVNILPASKPTPILIPETPEHAIPICPRALDINEYSPKICFDPTTNSGCHDVMHNNIRFTVEFQVLSDVDVALRRTTEAAPVARIKGKNKGDIIDFDEQDHTSWHYKMRLGEHFMIRNLEGYFIQGLILSLKHENYHGATEVCFAYSVDVTKTGRMVAL